MADKRREGREEAMKIVSKKEERRINFVKTYSAQLPNIEKTLQKTTLPTRRNV